MTTNREEAARVRMHVRMIRETGRSMGMRRFEQAEQAERKAATERAIMAARKVAARSAQAEAE